MDYHFKVACVQPLSLQRKIRNRRRGVCPTLFDVTCCLRLHTLLYIVGCCCAKFETDQTFSPVETDATLLPTTSDKLGSYYVRLHVALHVNRYFL